MCTKVLVVHLVRVHGEQSAALRTTGSSARAQGEAGGEGGGGGGHGGNRCLGGRG